MGRAVLRDERTSYEKADLTISRLPRPWEVIVRPDVYEHILRGDRERLHAQMRAALAERT